MQPAFYPIQRDREKVAALPAELGISEQDLVLVSGARDTGEEAALVGKLVGDQPFALVTSAYHMPRALKNFRRLGLNPVPAPCEFMNSKSLDYIEWVGIDAVSLLRSQLAIHEYLGIMWLSIKGYLWPSVATRAE
jgi:uncharacterized SAM-binding protein YcdF (DUF218 family)